MKIQAITIVFLSSLSLISGCDSLELDLAAPVTIPNEDVSGFCNGEIPVCDEQTACFLENAVNGEAPGISECILNCYRNVQLPCMQEEGLLGCGLDVLDCKAESSECVQDECIF